MSRIRMIVATCIPLLAGCADPMSYSDGISPEAGLAQKENLISETLAPRHVVGANPGGSGPRAVVVNQRYQSNESRAEAPSTGTGISLDR